MSVIDKTYFKGIIALPNLNESSNVETHLNNLIAYYEPKILIDLLGNSLYNDYVTGIAAGTQKYLDLRDGKSYTTTINGNTITVNWNGFKNDDKISLIAFFCYYYFLKDGQFKVTGVGTTNAKLENSILVSPRHKMVAAYNAALDLYGVPEKLKAGRSYNYVYDKYSDLPYFNSGYSIDAKPTAYNFIASMNKENGSDYYPNWDFTKLNYLNTIIT